MEQIRSVEEYKALVRENKQQQGKVRSNCFLMSSSLDQPIRDGQLFFERFADGLVVYSDEGRYYNSYYYWKMDKALEDIRKNKPVLMEELDSGREAQEADEKKTAFLLDAGFSLYRTNYQLDRTVKSDIQKTGALLEDYLQQAENRGMTVAPCRDEMQAAQVVSLWEQALEPTDVPWRHRRFMDYPEDTVYCVTDSEKTTAAAYWWGASGKKTWEGRHVVVRPDCFRQGLGTLLLQLCYEKALQAGVEKISTWICDENQRSLRLHEKNGFQRNGRTSRQYILR